MSNEESYSVSTLGFEERDCAVLRNLLRLSEFRSPSYRAHGRGTGELPHVIIVNTDKPEAVAKWQAFRKHYGSRYRCSDILLGAVSSEMQPRYHLSRPAGVAQLFSMLDRAVAQDHGFPGTAVSSSTFVLSADECDPTPVLHMAVAPTAPASQVAAPASIAPTPTRAEASAPPVQPGANAPAVAKPAAREEVAVILELPSSSVDELDALLSGVGVKAAEAPTPVPANADAAGAQQSAAQARVGTVKDRGPKILAGKARILVVDDSLPVRVQMITALQHYSSTVDFAASGEQAMSMLDLRRYDLIFLDIVLPGKDGYEVCRYIRRHAAHKKVPVIMLTSNSTPADRVKGRMAGCDTYLVKPVRQSVLDEVVADFITTAAPSAA